MKKQSIEEINDHELVENIALDYLEDSTIPASYSKNAYTLDPIHCQALRPNPASNFRAFFRLNTFANSIQEIYAFFWNRYTFSLNILPRSFFDIRIVNSERPNNRIVVKFVPINKIRFLLKLSDYNNIVVLEKQLFLPLYQTFFQTLFSC